MSDLNALTLLTLFLSFSLFTFFAKLTLIIHIALMLKFFKKNFLKSFWVLCDDIIKRRRSHHYLLHNTIDCCWILSYNLFDWAELRAGHESSQNFLNIFGFLLCLLWVIWWKIRRDPINKILYGSICVIESSPQGSDTFFSFEAHAH